jgi:DNA-binding response OmpR family regulator
MVASRCNEAAQSVEDKFMEAGNPGILIVDDNDDNRFTLSLLLETDGHARIVSASGGQEALSLLNSERFNLILLDMIMPDLNGDEVLKSIKNNPDTRDIPVVMISADTDTEKVAKCIELGADDYLPKPFNPTILRARVGAALRRESLRASETRLLNDLNKLNQQLEQRVADQVGEIERMSRLRRLPSPVRPVIE